MNKAAVAVMVVAATLAAPLQAKGPEGGKGPHGGFFGGGPGARFGDAPTTKIVEMMDKRLDLTDEQQAKMEAIITATREKVQPLTEQIGAAVKQSREEISSLLTEEQRAKIGDAKEDIFKGVGGFAANHKEEIRERVQEAGEEIRMRVALHKMDLNEEQRAKLQEINKSVREKQREIHEEVRPKVEELRKEAKEQIASVLTPDQQKELEQKLKDMPQPGRGEGGRGAAGFRGRRGPGGHGGPDGEQRPPRHRPQRDNGGADTVDQL